MGHAHVLKCPYGNGTYFGTKGSFQRAQNTLRDTELRKFFENLPSTEMREALADMLYKDLQDIGLRAGDYARCSSESKTDQIKHAVSKKWRPLKLLSDVYSSAQA